MVKTNNKKLIESYLKKLSIFGNITAKSMFGGYGFYLEGIMFALMAYEILYFKTDKETVEVFIKAKQKPFIFEGKPGRPIVMSYYSIPKSAWNSHENLKPWFELALDAARGNFKAKKIKTPKNRLKTK
ncbi:TfoX/Sxy family protein [Leptospira sp. 96542]|nr:TfoX/Sxy family protein [Leptospira sp. 96542]